VVTYATASPEDARDEAQNIGAATATILTLITSAATLQDNIETFVWSQGNFESLWWVVGGHFLCRIGKKKAKLFLDLIKQHAIQTCREV
jgi:hypothetical protein